MSGEFWQSAIMALGLVLIIEGVAPFLAPTAWRKYLSNALTMSDRTLRIMGFVLMVLGILVLQSAK